MVRRHAHTRPAGPEPDSPVLATAFALNAGLAIDASSLIHVDPRPEHGRRLLLSVEPLEPSARGMELAALALTTLRETFANAAALPPAAAIMKAFTAANAVLITENRPLAGCRWERRVYVGATGVVITGREMVIAQIPPTAAMIIQDHHLYAFPELASWRHDYMPGGEPEPEPLGCREGTRPFLFRTVAAPGDIITFFATAIARQLGRAEPDLLEALRVGDPETALDILGAIAVEHELDDAHAAVVHLRRLAPERGLPRLALPARKLATKSWPVVTPHVSHARAANDEGWATGLAHRPGPAYAVRTDWGAVGIPLDRPLPTTFALDFAAGSSNDHLAQARRLGWPFGPLGRVLAMVAARFAPRPLAAPGAARTRSRRHLLAAPGAGSVRRYRDAPTVPAEWRSNLPRGLDVHVPARLLTVGFVLFLAFGGSGALLDRYRQQIARADAALATVNGSLAAITADPASAVSALAAAEAALAAARGAGAEAAAVHRHALAVDAARDLAAANLRLREVTRLGALPPSLLEHDVHLARTGRDVWLIGGGLYGLDQTTNRLVQVLGPGSAVQGGVVQTLRTGAADGSHLVVADDAALYARDETGRWQRYFTPYEAGAAPLGSASLATYQGSLYALEPGGRVLKFAANRLTEPPTGWMSTAAYPELAASRDLVIDGRVHLLLEDGRILTFFRGTLEATKVPAVTPSLVNPTRLVGGPDTNFLYVVDPGAEIGLTTGRLVRVDGAGHTQQILPPLPTTDDAASAETAQILSRVRDLAIDEEAGLVYFITDTELWRATLPR